MQETENPPALTCNYLFCLVQEGAMGPRCSGAWRLFLSELGQLCFLSSLLACTKGPKQREGIPPFQPTCEEKVINILQGVTNQEMCKGELRDHFFLWCLPVLILALCSPQLGLSLCGMTESTLDLSVCLSRASWQVQLSYYTTWQQLTHSYSTMASKSFSTDDHKSQTSIYTMSTMNRAHLNYVDNKCNKYAV